MIELCPFCLERKRLTKHHMEKRVPNDSIRLCRSCHDAVEEMSSNESRETLLFDKYKDPAAWNSILRTMRL